MSLAECTARSIRPSSRASSISLVNSPLPPASASGRSVMRSPVVRIGTTDSTVGRAAHGGDQAAPGLFGLGEGKRAAAGADADRG